MACRGKNFRFAQHLACMLAAPLGTAVTRKQLGRWHASVLTLRCRGRLTSSSSPLLPFFLLFICHRRCCPCHLRFPQIPQSLRHEHAQSLAGSSCLLLVIAATDVPTQRLRRGGPGGAQGLASSISGSGLGSQLRHRS